MEGKIVDVNYCGWIGRDRKWYEPRLIYNWLIWREIGTIINKRWRKGQIWNTQHGYVRSAGINTVKGHAE